MKHFVCDGVVIVVFVQSAGRRVPVARDARDAFFKADATGAVPVKTDTNLRERDIDKESEKPMLSSGLISKPAPKDVENYIGFASLPNQVYRKSVKRGFEFTLMVVGELLLLLIFTSFSNSYQSKLECRVVTRDCIFILHAGFCLY